MPTIKAAFLQYSPLLAKSSENITIIRQLLKSLEHTELLVLPELASSGYNFTNEVMAYAHSEPIEGGDFTSYLCEESKARNTYIIAGINERDEGKLYNTSVLIGPSGIIGKYRKLHLFYNEKLFFEPGDKAPQVYDTPIGRLGMLICFDWMFPELWRIMAMKGCQIIAHPSNLVMPYAQTVIPSYSIINRIFIITANRCGHERELSFTGSSVISNPKGLILAQAGPEETKYGLCRINTDEADDKKINAKNHLFDDRRSSFYKEIL